MTAVSTREAVTDTSFQHEAFFYAGEAAFLEGTTEFIREGVQRGESVMVALPAARMPGLRASFAADADRVAFVDMEEVGRNPARIIPAWRAFLDANLVQGRGVRGIGEPIWASRSAAELVECQHHEALLNLAFAGSGSWRLLCPYDVAALPGEVIEEAHRSHPIVLEGGASAQSPQYRDGHPAPSFPDRPLPEPLVDPGAVTFTVGELAAVRQMVARHAELAGLDVDRAEELMLGVHEIATNSLRHGGGQGTLRAWRDHGTLICEISDAGRITDPLVGRRQPTLDQLGGRGVWLANQLCDLVQIRSGAEGTVVRLHVTT